MIASPHKRLGDITLISSKQREQIDSWNGSKFKAPRAVVRNIITQRANENPNGLAVRDADDVSAVDENVICTDTYTSTVPVVRPAGSSNFKTWFAPSRTRCRPRQDHPDHL